MDKPIITGFGYEMLASNVDIYHKIVDEPKCWEPKEYTYLITGRPGPTGKTWLAARLNEAGLKAIDISERLIRLVEVKDMAGNYFTIDHVNKVVYIVLNNTNYAYLRKQRNN